MIYDFSLKGVTITEATDDDFIDVDVIQVRVEDTKNGGYAPLLTCAGFCASIIGVRGFILTPNQLRRKLNGRFTKSTIISTSRD